jgi:hypothetical protein
MTNGDNGNGYQTPLAMVVDMVNGVKANLFDPEGLVGDVNVLGMERVATKFNILNDISAQGGLLRGLQTGIRKQTAARRGQRTGSPPPRRAPPRRDTGQVQRPPQQPASPMNGQPDRLEILL